MLWRHKCNVGGVNVIITPGVNVIITPGVNVIITPGVNVIITPGVNVIITPEGCLITCPALFGLTAEPAGCCTYPLPQHTRRVLGSGRQKLA